MQYRGLLQRYPIAVTPRLGICPVCPGRLLPGRPYPDEVSCRLVYRSFRARLAGFFVHVMADVQEGVLQVAGAEEQIPSPLLFQLCPYFMI